MLRTRGVGNTEAEKIRFALKFNTHHMQPDTLSHFRNVLNDAGFDPDLFKKKLYGWYNETMDRVNGWYKRKMQFILFWLGFIIAMSFNVDSIKIARLLAIDKEARGQMVELGIKAADGNSTVTKIVTQTGDTAVSDSILKSGYKEVRKAMDETNKILGLGWQFESRTKAARVGLEVYPKTMSGLQRDFIIPSVRLAKSAGSCKAILAKLKDPKKKELCASILKRKTDSLAFLVNRFNRITGAEFIPTDSIHATILKNTGETQCVTYSGRKTYGFFDSAGFVISQAVPWRLSFWGFVITALMLSLGSNFWFDFLKKLVAIRGAGVKPEEKKPDPDEVAETTAKSREESGALLKQTVAPSPVASDFVTEAINRFAPEIKKIPGVKSVFKGFSGAAGALEKVLQINVSDENTMKIVQDKYPELLVDEVPVKVSVVVAGNPQNHQALQGQIANASGNNGAGSLGCTLRNKVSGNLHLLSCWHVMKGNYSDYDSDDDQVMIIDSVSGQVIGKRWGGGIEGTMDYGIAKCLNKEKIEKNQWLKNKLSLDAVGYRPVSTRDIDGQIPVFFYNIFSGAKKEGKIYSDCGSVDIHYIDKVREMNDMLVLTDNSFSSAISQEGNSGAVVFDTGGKAIGMIVAGDNRYTYAMKLSHFFDIFDDMEMDS